MYHDNDKIKSKGYLINSRENGEWSYYDTSGAKIEYGKYVNGIPVGDWWYHLDTGEVFISWVSIDTIIGFNKIELAMPSTCYILKSGMPNEIKLYENVGESKINFINFQIIEKERFFSIEEYIESFSTLFTSQEEFVLIENYNFGSGNHKVQYFKYKVEDFSGDYFLVSTVKFDGESFFLFTFLAREDRFKYYWLIYSRMILNLYLNSTKCYE